MRIRPIVHNIVKLGEKEVTLDAVIAALANPQRRGVIELLALQPATIQQVASHVGLSLTAINRHLAVLEYAGLLQRRKSGRVNFLAIRRSGLRLLQHWLNDFHPQWGSDEEALDNYIAALSRTTRQQHDRDKENP